jgi:hypothetical protein
VARKKAKPTNQPRASKAPTRSRVSRSVVLRILLALAIVIGVSAFLLMRSGETHVELKATTREALFRLGQSSSLEVAGSPVHVIASGFASIELWRSLNDRVFPSSRPDVDVWVEPGGSIAVQPIPLPPARDISIVGGPGPRETRIRMGRATSAAQAVHLSLSGPLKINGEVMMFESGRATLQAGTDSHALYFISSSTMRAG